jgi:hypothetical protein
MSTVDGLQEGLLRLTSAALHLGGKGDRQMAWLQMLLLVVIAIAVSGCELAGGIFKAGAWVGALAVVLIIAVIGFIAAKIAS